ncbi:hypothetical protein WDC_0392 [Paucilactobacillus wasatchensis]|uniref:Uncharacterized protein n=1 Tax=Paucilactobacillus wasatchensis TaxID=1335616 RepID=A0A0D0Y712_9LACO|nr:hypothetical protein WDC_0392 [Paucilactobacillus wasatchensis]
MFYKYQEKYNNVDASPNLINQLKSGQPFTGLQDLDGEITVSSAPIELICSVLKVALENAGATSLSKRDYEFRENAINNCVLMLQARFAS